MLSYEKLAKKPKQFLKFTGMTIDDFDLIIVDIKKEFKRTEEKRLSARKRKRSIGAGHPYSLSVKDRAIMMACLLSPVRHV